MNIAQKIGARLASTKTFGAGNYLNPGKGVLVVTALKAGTRPEFHNGDTAVGEFVVLECEGFTGIVDENGKAKPAGNPLGSTVASVHQLEQNSEVAWPNLLGMLRGIFGNDMSEEGIAASAAEHAKETGKPQSSEDEFARMFDYLTGKEQPARGMVVGYSTVEKKTKKGQMISVVKWEPLEALNTQEEVARRRAQLDAAQKVTK